MSRKSIRSLFASAMPGAVLIAGILSLTTVAFATAAAQSGQPLSQHDGCLPAGAEIQLSNCNALIRSSAQDLSNALIARGNAYREIGKLDQAIQDLTLAINLSNYYAIPRPCVPTSVLVPASALAYRGLTFEAKDQIELAKKDYLWAYRAAPAPTSLGKTSSQIAIERLTALGSLPEAHPLPSSEATMRPNERVAGSIRPAC
jgi:tetratricopeptide (TPR) repeat protein